LAGINPDNYISRRKGTHELTPRGGPVFGGSLKAGWREHANVEHERLHLLSPRA
jgi:hypothetical protein